MKRYSVSLLAIVLIALNAAAQNNKIINRQSQAWVSLNSTWRITSKWGFVADLHQRRTHFFSDNSFDFLRFGISYRIKDNLTVVAGYGHMWMAPTTPGFSTWADENRIYEQAQLMSGIGRVSMLQRIRNEQRWQEKIVNDKETGTNKFTDRVRYLLSFNIPVFKNPWYPAIVVSDELCVQFGKEVVYNTFEQNRVFLGIKQPVTKNLSFDVGYMLVTQQKPSGNVYDENHTFRWFFYYTPDLRKKITRP
jgi:hypothetical protein